MMLFIDNKYRRWYFQIVDRARGRVRGPDMERHHVIPRALAGTNAADNLVLLTYREHFLAHWMLTKMTSGAAAKSMRWALWSMTWRSKTHTRAIAGWQYAIARSILPEMGRAMGASGKGQPKAERHRTRIADALRGQPKSAEHKAKLALHSPSPEHRKAISEKLKGRTYSAETIERMRAASTGRTQSPETRAKRSAALSGRVMSDECREKIGAAQRGVKRGPHSPEHRAKISAAAMKRGRDASGRWVEKKTGRHDHA